MQPSTMRTTVGTPPYDVNLGPLGHAPKPPTLSRKPSSRRKPVPTEAQLLAAERKRDTLLFGDVELTALPSKPQDVSDQSEHNAPEELGFWAAWYVTLTQALRRICS